MEAHNIVKYLEDLETILEDHAHLDFVKEVKRGVIDSEKFYIITGKDDLVPFYTEDESGLIDDCIPAEFIPYKNTYIEMEYVCNIDRVFVDKVALVFIKMESETWRVFSFYSRPLDQGWQMRTSIHTICGGDLSVVFVPPEAYQQEFFSAFSYLFIFYACKMFKKLNNNGAVVDKTHTFNYRTSKRTPIEKRLPFFSYKTLKINPSRNVCQRSGNNIGTGVSPRQHMRRGHMRTIKSGKSFWVRQCVVGKITNGMVSKEYHIESTAVN